MLFAVLALVVSSTSHASEMELRTVETRIRDAKTEHPRLLMVKGGEKRVSQLLQRTPAMRAAYDSIRLKADGFLNAAPITYEKTGRRLLGVSREALERIHYLAFCFRMTNDRRYLEAAEREMLAAAGFGDWNPSHFLDVAEMTAALAIGYDWLYAHLSQETRETIKRAIVEKGIEPSFAEIHWWIGGDNNWNQVCHGGMILGALAVLEDDRDQAVRVVKRALEGLPNAMKEYAPDGAYPEGPGYWTYGTSYNVILIAALESALGTDFGIAQADGFLDSAAYRLHMIGPTGQYFNYCDCGSGVGLSPAAAWFASRQKRYELLLHEHETLRASRGRSGGLGRFGPLLLVWAPSVKTIRPPLELSWRGGGANPVAVHRSSWTDRNAVFVGIKGGSPGSNHAHMDSGAFILSADGVRWAIDLGMQDYNSLESLGLNIWDRSQNSDRWKVFRYTNAAHNTLVVDGKHQLVSGNAKIIAHRAGPRVAFTIVDMSDVYEGQLEKAHRGVQLKANRQAIVQDELTAPNGRVSVRWGIVTRANVKIGGKGAATLTQDGKRMLLRVISPKNVELREYRSDPPPAPHDAANPGTRILGFEAVLEAGTSETLLVEFTPQQTHVTRESKIRPLAKW